jgi:uncharacterized protein (TIGR02996 family)
MTNEEDFQKQLDENIEDHVTRLVLADYLEEIEDPRAEGYRFLGKYRKYPTIFNRMYGWMCSSYETGLPHTLFVLMYPFYLKYLSDGDSNTRKETEDRVATIWSGLPDKTKALIIKEQETHGQISNCN